MAKIQDYINNKHKYKVDRNYQRPPDAWSKADEQCLIDTILKEEPMPMFFLNQDTKKDIIYIVDGQQRLNAIRKFYDNEIKLNKRFSGDDNHGKTFNSENPINDEQRQAFLDYKLNFRILEDYDDERVRLIFSRLQRGKPLTLGERLNAMPGKIVERMREIANHPFIKNSIGVSKGRYGSYPDAARILYYEKFGAKQMGSNELYSFFEDYKDLSENDRDYKNVISVLNFLTKCFPSDPGDYKFLEKHAWVLAVYSTTRELKKGYSLNGLEESIRKFVEDFHGKVYNEDFRNSNIQYQRFYDNVRGGWSEKIISLRRDTLYKELLNKLDIEELDGKRQITDEEKISAYSKQSKCELCDRSFKDYREAEYHHRKKYSEGGKSDISNILVVCKNCHKKIHGKQDIKLPSEDEIEENNDL